MLVGSDVTKRQTTINYLTRQMGNQILIEPLKYSEISEDKTSQLKQFLRSNPEVLGLQGEQ